MIKKSDGVLEKMEILLENVMFFSSDGILLIRAFEKKCSGKHVYMVLVYLRLCTLSQAVYLHCGQFMYL